MRKGKRYISDESLYTTIGVDTDGNEKRLEDILEDSTSDFVSDYEEEATYEEIRKVVQTLPDRDRKIIMLYFGFIDDKTYTQGEISELLNISQSWVSRLVPEIIKRIEKQLKKNGVIEVPVSHSKETNIYSHKNMEQIECQDNILEEIKGKKVKIKIPKKL